MGFFFFFYCSKFQAYFLAAKKDKTDCKLKRALKICPRPYVYINLVLCVHVYSKCVCVMAVYFISS